jgi:hypothetical protein
MKLRNQNGAVAVELALLSPLLVLLIFGMIEFGLLIFNKQVITNAAREGARFGIVSKTPRYSVDEIKKVAEDYCKTHLVTFGSEKLNIDPVPKHLDGSVISAAELISGTPVKSIDDYLIVTVTYDYDFLVLKNIGFFDTLPINSVARMNYE